MSQQSLPKKSNFRERDLTRDSSGVEIRLELITTCYRPDRTATQIIAMAKELEQYVFSGEPTEAR